MRSRSWPLILTGFMLLILAPALPAQDEAQPSPRTWGGLETQGSVTAGYRFTDVQGRREKFLELFDLQKGFRVMDFNLLGRAPDGGNPFADNYSLSLSGLGGEPFAGGQFTLRKDKVYDLRVNYRQTYYYWNRNDNAVFPVPLHALTSNHDWATVRRLGSVNLLVHATNNLRFNLEYQRASRGGVNFTTRTMEYFDSEEPWGAFLRANPYYVEAPLSDISNRLTGGVSYSWRGWSLHYRLGYQSLRQLLTWHNVGSPERSINVDASATSNEELTGASWWETRKLNSPVSEFSYAGKIGRRLDVRGGYIFYRYRGPDKMAAWFSGSARTNSQGTAFAPYAISVSAQADLTEPYHVVDEGLTLKIKDWWNLHADYRYARFTTDGHATFHSRLDPATETEGETDNQWRAGTHLLDVNMEFFPTRSLIVRPGLRYLKRDIIGLADGEIDDVHTRRLKTVWPTLSVYFQPSKMFSVRGDLQSATSGASYTRISPHTDVGSRFVFRLRPTAKISIEDNLILRTRKFQAADFESNIRSNAMAISYAFRERFSVFGGFSYDSFLATGSATFIRGTPPLTAALRDQTVNRVWQAGIAANPLRHLGINLSGNFVRSTGAGEIAGEPPYFGPLTWPLATGTIYYDFPKLGRLSIDLQRTYYLEEIVRGNDFQANLLTIRWTRDF